jgi:Relaxase/Mobilisation nuclease domain
VIGKIIIGKSYRKCISYCLSNKPGQNESRAKILESNFINGSKKEIIDQFEELGKMNPGLANNVMHITLSWPPRDILSADKLKTIANECGSKFGFNKNQSIVIQHNDTKHQHIHIVVNRVGFDGKTLSDSNNYKKMSDFCRAMERKYNLTTVLSPKRFQPREQREVPRLDNRKEKLKSDILNALIRYSSFEEFEKCMNASGYEIIKGRGIAFRDREKVYTKGSQVGYSLSIIKDQLDANVKYRSILLKRNLKKTPSIDKISLVNNEKNLLKKLLEPNIEMELSILLPKKRKKKKSGLSI